MVNGHLLRPFQWVSVRDQRIIALTKFYHDYLHYGVDGINIAVWIGLKSLTSQLLICLIARP